MKKINMPSGFALGATSLLGAFVILSLLAFALLTYTTGANDRALAERTAAVSGDYYNARSKVEVELADTAAEIAAGAAQDLEHIVGVDSGNLEILIKEAVDEKRYVVCEALFDESGNILRKKIYTMTE
ncbi:MAG: hypothetical protein Q4C00_06325 [Bacillota bacterium]|nr:hypothetical protein [Bacillota bacterium]